MRQKAFAAALFICLTAILAVYVVQGTRSSTHALGANEPWDWGNAAERFNREKRPIAAILLEAEKVEPCIVKSTLGIDRYKVICQERPLLRSVSARLAAIILDPRSYVSPGYGMKPCEFAPSLAFRFWKRGQFLDVIVCLSCYQLLVVEQDPAVPIGSLGGFEARFRVAGDFDPARGYMKLLIGKSFPHDPDLERVLKVLD